MRLNAIALWLLAAMSLTGCSILGQGLCGPKCHSEKHESTSLVDFLYPNGAVPPPDSAIPELRLPLRVGLAFLPSQRAGVIGGFEAARRDALLEQIRSRFAERKFVREIVIIPDYYLQGRHGAESLHGVQRLYGIDVMALVSYDQVTYMENNEWSLAYLTIVGGYVVKGSQHDIVTLMDLAVIDPSTRQLVLRSGGTDTRRRNTTLVDQRAEVRQSAGESLQAASSQMLDHFDTALTKFEADVRAGKANVRVANRNGDKTAGGGALSELLLLMLFVAALLRRGAQLHKKTDFAP